jgi:hypothetical protein
MKNRWIHAAAILSLLGLAGPLRAQDLPGYTLQETLQVPVTGAQVSSQSPLLQGVLYKLRALGHVAVRVPGPSGSTLSQADAEYAFGAAIPFRKLSAGSCMGVDVGLAANDTGHGAQKSPSWGAFNPAHVYTVDFTGLGAPLAMSFHVCTSAGSAGTLTVQIFRPMGMTLPASGPPEITDVSPGLDTFAAAGQHSVSGRIVALAVAPDGRRLYAGTFAGVWRSDDGGETWRQMTRPQPAGAVLVPGGLLAPDVYDLAISPANPDVVLAGVENDLHTPAQNGIYRSEDGGGTWTLVQRFTCSNGGQVPQVVFAPDDPSLAFAAGGCAIGISGDGGRTWSEKVLPAQNSFPNAPQLAAWHVAVAPFEPLVANEHPDAVPVGSPIEVARGVRRVYALGSNQMFYSIDGGQSWTEDAGIGAIVSQAGVGGAAAAGSGNSSRVLVIEPGNPGHVLVAVNTLANGPSFYAKHACGWDAGTPEVADGTACNTSGSRHCGEGSLWLGDFSGFVPADPNRHASTWRQLPGPPVYFGVSSPSGDTYVDVKPAGSSYLLFFSDRSHVHVSAGLPAAGGWHRLDGLDASQTAPPHPADPDCNNLLMHVDPHAMAVAANFALTLKAPPAATPAPFNQNKVVATSAGDLWLTNDGGVYHASGNLAAWRPSRGLSTLATINLAGLAVKGSAPALYFGTGDNDDFYSVDGGASWKDPQGGCGDCDPWFADPAQVRQVMGFGARTAGGGFLVYTNATKYPQPEAHPTDGTVLSHWVCPNDCDAVSSFSVRGYRPMVLTPAGVTAPSTGDFVIIGTKGDGSRVVFRKTNAAAMDTPQDWENPAKATQYGPALPPCTAGAPADCFDVVQASGGHTNPVVYVGDPGDGPNAQRTHLLTLWKWAPGMQSWQQIVPSPASTPARERADFAHRFFVDPFHPNTLYLLDDAAIKRSDDGGATWNVDTSLDDAVTEGQRYSYTGDFAVLKDIVFVREESRTRFAVGNAGVFATLNGSAWFRLLSTSALPSHPVSAYFDNLSDPCDRALYVGMDGRGILRLDPIPSPAPLNTAGGDRLCTNGTENHP